MTTTTTRPTWDEYFIKIATDVASRSTCLRVPDGVGAVLVKNKHILATGYAGSFKDQPHCTDVGCLIDPVTKGCIRTVHAECNAVLQAAQHGINIGGSTVYCTMSPCWDCFKMLVNGGIVRIVYDTEYRTVDLQKEYAKNLGIGFEHISDKKYTGSAKSEPVKRLNCKQCGANPEEIQLNTVDPECVILVRCPTINCINRISKAVKANPVQHARELAWESWNLQMELQTTPECPDCVKYLLHCPTCHKDHVPVVDVSAPRRFRPCNS
jgi:dCMP deaminase